MDLFAVMEDIDENLQRKSVRHEGRHTGSRVWLLLFSGFFSLQYVYNYIRRI